MNKFFCVSFVKKITAYIYTFFVITLLHTASHSFVFAMDPHTANLYNNLWEYAKSDQTLSELEDLIENKNNNLDINQPGPENRTVLHIAALHGAEATLEYLLDLPSEKRARLNESYKAVLKKPKVEIDAHDSNDYTALHLAIINNHLTLAKRLIEAGAQLNIKTGRCWHALYFAAAYAKDKEFVKFLIGKSREVQFEIDVAADDDEDEQYAHTKSDFFARTPLMVACYFQNRPAAEALLEADAKISTKSHWGENALHAAAFHADKEFIKFLIEKSENVQLDINTLAQVGYMHEYTPLMIAIKSNNQKAAEFFLQVGTQISIKNRQGNNALHHAAKHLHNKDFIQSLIKESEQFEPNIDTPNNQGYTPLMLAIENKNKAAIQELLKAGANINIQLPMNHDTSSKGFAGYNSLHIAVEKYYADEFIALIRLIENELGSAAISQALNAHSHDTSGGMTPLHLAAANGNLSALQYFIKKINAFCYSRTKKLLNILDCAALKNQIKIIEWLLKDDHLYQRLMFNPMIMGRPFHFAAERGHSSALESIIKYLKPQDRHRFLEEKSPNGENVWTLALKFKDLLTAKVVFHFIKNHLEGSDFNKMLCIGLAAAAQVGNTAALEMMLEHIKKPEDRKIAIQYKDAHGKDIWTYALESGDVHTVKMVLRFMEKDPTTTDELNQKLLIPSISAPHLLGHRNFPICFAAKKRYFPIVNLLKEFFPSPLAYSPEQAAQEESCGIEDDSIACASIILNRFADLKYKSTFVTPVHPIHAAVKYNFFNWLPLFANEVTLQILDNQQKTTLDNAHDNWWTKANHWVTQNQNTNPESFFYDSNVLIYLMLESLPTFTKIENLQSKYLNNTNVCMQNIQDFLQTNPPAALRIRALHIKYILELLQKIIQASPTTPVNQKSYQKIYEQLALKIIAFFNEKQQSLPNDFPSENHTELKKTYHQHIGYVFFHPRMLEAFKKIKSSISVENFTVIENSIRLAYAKTIMNDWLMQIPQTASDYIFSNNNNLKTIIASALSNSKESMDAFKNALKFKIEEKEVFYHLGILNDYIKTIYLNHQPWQSDMTRALKKHLSILVQNPRIESFVKYANWHLTKDAEEQHIKQAEKPSFGFYPSQVSAVKFILDFHQDLQDIINNGGKLHQFKSVKQDENTKEKKNEFIDILPYSMLMK